MRVQVHTKICFLCVLTFLIHQCNHCNGEKHSHQHHGHHSANHTHNHSDLQISEASYVKGATPSLESNSPQRQTPEEEQHFYIQQLFQRYGQKGRLDFQGFQSLLFSLGLGEVKVVSAHHEDLGHDHVAHLDLLDVQEGLHSHSSTNEGHSRKDEHEHRHGHPHRKTNPHHAHTVQTPTQCKQQATPGPASDAPEGHDHEHDEHNHEHGHDHGHKNNHKHVHSHEHSHNHKHGHEHDQDYEHDSSHSHKNKREASGGPPTPTLPGPVSSGHPGGLSHQHEECLNLTQLLSYYGLNPDSAMTPLQFSYLCPALLYQIDSRVCIRHYHQMDVEQEAMQPASSVWVWLWGFVSITIISLLSLLGVVLIPILKQSCFKFLLTFLVALAVGTLSGDALLHLLPHSQGHHDHSEEGKSHDTSLATAFDGVWKGLTALAGIYLLFIIEHCIGMFKHYKDHRGRRKANKDGKIGRKLSDHKLNRRSDAEWLHLKPLSDDPNSSAISCNNGHNDTQLTDLQPPDSPTNKTPLAQDHHSPTRENGRMAKRQGNSHGHGHSHGGNCHSDQEMKDAGIASIAWMVIMGDGMHNFSDGLAIGAAFSANLTGGISTSVAVFCHELPHELGDFAVLLKAGMTVKQAIVYNLLSALMAYVGMLIGTAVGQYTHSVTSWIFAITAGMFLYVALVDMLPEMLHGDSEDHKRCQLGHFVLQNLGMLTGFGIMLLIAIFEDQIVFEFGF